MRGGTDNTQGKCGKILHSASGQVPSLSPKARVTSNTAFMWFKIIFGTEEAVQQSYHGVRDIHIHAAILLEQLAKCLKWVICLLSALADESMTLCIKVSNGDLVCFLSKMLNWSVYSVHQVILQIINAAIHNKINHQQQSKKVLWG